MWVGGQRHAPAALPPVPIVWEVEWVPGPVWTGAENVAPTGIQSPDPTALTRPIVRVTGLIVADEEERNTKCSSLKVPRLCSLVLVNVG